MKKGETMFRSGHIALILLLTCLATMSGCEGCLKTYYLTGMVTDSSYNPLPDVQVVLGDIIATTGSDGGYAVQWPAQKQTLSSIDGESVIFVKEGYQTVTADPFTFSEAGPDICGSSITLRRDAVMQLQ